MDVIEGRGVTALVHNPNKYQRRKRDNKKSNDTKQDLQEKGKQLHMLEASASASASPAPPPEPALDQRERRVHEGRRVRLHLRSLRWASVSICQLTYQALTATSILTLVCRLNSTLLSRA